MFLMGARLEPFRKKYLSPPERASNPSEHRRFLRLLAAHPFPYFQSLASAATRQIGNASKPRARMDLHLWFIWNEPHQHFGGALPDVWLNRLLVYRALLQVSHVPRKLTHSGFILEPRMQEQTKYISRASAPVLPSPFKQGALTTAIHFSNLLCVREWAEPFP